MAGGDVPSSPNVTARRPEREKRISRALFAHPRPVGIGEPWLIALVMFVGFMLQNAGATPTILAVAGWALLPAIIALLAPTLRHPPDLDRSDGPEPPRAVA